MSSLFVLSTPLQMLTSQQLIRQENIKDAILLESSFSTCNSFQPSYDVCRIDELWMTRLEPVLDFPSWDAQGISLHKTAVTTYYRFRKLIKLLRKYDVETIYLADYQNQTYRFMTESLSQRGYKVCFFEEGYSHYVPRIGTINSGFIAKAKEYLLDFWYYLPFYHIRFAKWRNNPNRPYQGLHIYKRYSIVPGFHDEPFDERLYCKPMISRKLEAILKNVTDYNQNDKRVLLLTDPMSEVLNSAYRYLYFDVIKNNLSKIDKNHIIYIKYHPRDKEEDKLKTLEIVKSLNLNYRILSTSINIPVEYFLLGMRFQIILFFNTSTFFYNGHMFPKCNFHQLLPELLDACKKHSVPKENINQILLLIQKMSQI